MRRFFAIAQNDIIAKDLCILLYVKGEFLNKNIKAPDNSTGAFSQNKTGKAG